MLSSALRGRFTWKRGALNRVPLITVFYCYHRRFISGFSLEGSFVHKQCLIHLSRQLLLHFIAAWLHLWIHVILVKCLVLLQRFLLRFDLHPFYKNTHTQARTHPLSPPPPPPTVPLGGVEFPPSPANLPGSNDAIGCLGE